MSNQVYYVGNCNYLIRFEDYDRMKIFLDNEPQFSRIYGRQARIYPQYKIVSDPRLREELVVNRYGEHVGFFTITYWGRYDGLKLFSDRGYDLIQTLVKLDAEERENSNA